MSDKYILEGKTAVLCSDLVTWARWFEENRSKRVVAKTELPDKGSTVSTVFLGLDHAYGEGDPQIFETLVFDGKLEGEMNRYSTWDEAEAGHKAMVERVKATL